MSLPEAERLDLFTLDAVAEIADGAAHDRIEQWSWECWRKDKEKRMAGGPYVMGGIDQHIMRNPGPPPIHDALPDDVE